MTGERGMNERVVYLLESNGYDQDQYVMGVFATPEAAQRASGSEEWDPEEPAGEWWERKTYRARLAGGVMSIKRMKVQE